MPAHGTDPSPADVPLQVQAHTKHTSGYCSFCSCEAEHCKGKPAQYKSLYEMLDRMQYILANNAESHVECNEPMWEALREGVEEAFYSEKMLYSGLNTERVLGRELTPEEEEMTGEEFLESLSDEQIKDDVRDAVADSDYPEIYQTFVVDHDSFNILKDYGQTVWHNEDMDLHFWGVHHWGTAWSHVMNSVYPVQNQDYYKKYS